MIKLSASPIAFQIKVCKILLTYKALWKLIQRKMRVFERIENLIKSKWFSILKMRNFDMYHSFSPFLSVPTPEDFILRKNHYINYYIIYWIKTKCQKFFFSKYVKSLHYTVCWFTVLTHFYFFFLSKNRWAYPKGVRIGPVPDQI